MGLGHKHSVDDGHDHSADLLGAEGAELDVAEYTLDLRIAAIFVIFAFSLIGSIPPLFLKRSTHGVIGAVVRAFSAGVILSLAIVHVYPHAAMDLEEVVEFPVAGAATVFGILLLVFIEHGLNTFLSSHTSHDHKDHGKADIDIEKHGDEHAHACMHHEGTSSWLKSASDTASVRAQVFAYMMEIGCVFHSVLIGISMGVQVDHRKEVVALLIALTFHQFLEGISLGSVVNAAGFSMVKGMSMVVLYSLTVPVGIAVGIGIASAYDHSSVAAMAVQGTLSAVAGGMLLYVALIQLVGEEFSRQELHSNPKLKIAMFVSLTLGAAAMCLLAVWA